MPPKKVNTLFDGGDKSGGGNKGTKKTDNKKPGKWSNVHTLGGTVEHQDGNTTHSFSGNFARNPSAGRGGVEGTYRINHHVVGTGLDGSAHASVGVDTKKGAHIGRGVGASYNFGGDRQITVGGGVGVEASTSSGIEGTFSAGVSANVDDNHNVGLSVGPGSLGLTITTKVTKEFYTEEGFGLEK